MSGCTIHIEDLDPPYAKRSIPTNSLLEDAKAYAEAKRTPRTKVSVVSPRGTRYAMVPRQGNTGPGRWVWRRV